MRFEWVKWKRSSKNVLLLVILFLSVGIQLANQWDSNKYMDESNFKELKEMADEIQPPQGYSGPAEAYKLLQHFDDSGNFASPEDKEQYNRVFDILYLLEAENTARNNQEWQERLSIQTERLTLQKEYIDLGGTQWQSISYKEIEKQMERNDWLNTRNIQLEDLSTSPKGNYFVYSLLKNWMELGISVLLVGLFFFDFLAGEYERKTYLLMAVQPMSKRSWYRKKTAAALLIAVFSFSAYLTVGWLTASVIFGTGSFDYPILIDQGNSYHYVTLGVHFLKSVSLQLLFLFFLVQLILLLSNWLKNSLEILGLFVLAMLVPNILAEFIPEISRVGEWLPVFYMNVESFLTGGSSFSYPFLSGAAVLLAGNILLAVMSDWMVEKR